MIKMKLLFIGNSYTYFNDLPKIAAQNLAARGFTVSYESVTAGGYTLERHISENDFPAILSAGGYDYVILQEQSVRPASEPDKFLDSAAALSDMIKAAGAIPVFYETWPRRDVTDGMTKKGWSRESIAALLRASYERAAKANGGLIAYAGDALDDAFRGEAGGSVYDSDGSHPSQSGSEIAAGVIAEAIAAHENGKCDLMEKSDK